MQEICCSHTYTQNYHLIKYTEHHPSCKNQLQGLRLYKNSPYYNFKLLTIKVGGKDACD